MNRTYLQAIAILMGTVATTFVAAEWRWEPANAGNYLVIVGPSPGHTDEIAGAGEGAKHAALARQARAEFR